MKRKPVVVIVGCDMTGKSHIAKELAIRLGVPYYKASAEHTSFLTKQDRFLNDIRYADPARFDLLRQLNIGVVFDRGFPCEWVYSRFFERPSDDRAVFAMDEAYANIGTLIVVTARKSYKGIKDDLDERIDEAALRQLEQLYDEFMCKTTCSVMKLFVDDEDLDREVNDILNVLEELNEQ